MAKTVKERKAFILVSAEKVQADYCAGRITAEGALAKIQAFREVVNFEGFSGENEVLETLRSITDWLFREYSKRDGKKAAEYMSNFVNGAGSKEVSAFQEQMTREHRTLQQSFTRLCMGWLFLLSKSESYDGRNEASVKLAQKIFASLDEGEAYLPLI
jgi:hypothetical protein